MGMQRKSLNSQGWRKKVQPFVDQMSQRSNHDMEKYSRLSRESSGKVLDRMRKQTW